MKKIMMALILTALFASLSAQAPQGISHQAVIRNAANELVNNAPIGLKVSIIQETADGVVVFSETHIPISNANGLISFVIGHGTPLTGSFEEIDWANGPYFVKTEADPEGGTNYTIEGVSQLWSVPYALSAGTSGAGIAAGDSLVLKDDQGMTRFVLNPNTGMLKMMHNDTVWYSVEVGSPHVITHLNDDGSLTVSKGNGYEIYVFDETEKNKDNPKRSVKHEQTAERDKFTTTTTRNDPNFGDGYHKTTTEFHTKRDEYGNYLTTEKTQTDIVSMPDGTEKQRSVTFEDLKSGLATLEIIEDGQTTFYQKEYYDETGNKIIEMEYTDNGTTNKKRLIYNKLGELISEETFENDTRQSETTHTSSIVPDMGFRSNTVTEETFQGEEETLIKKEIKTTSSKHSPGEKYEETVTSNQFYENGVISREVSDILKDRWHETVKVQEHIAKMFNPAGEEVSEIKIVNTSDANYNHESGSMSRSNTTEMLANDVKIADKNVSMNHYPDPSNYTEDSESSATYMPDGSLISKTETERTTWPGGTLEERTKTFIDNNGSTIKIRNKSNNGLPLIRTLTKDGIYREHNSFTHNDNTNKVVTSFKNQDNSTTAKLTEEFNKNDAIHSRTVENPFVSSTSISQGSSEIEFTADQVVTDGNQVVTGSLNTLGDSSVSGNHDVYGNSNVEGDQEVGGNLSTLLDMIAKGKKKFRIDHPQFPDTKFLQHASIESNEVLNLYSGNVETDIDGNATVTLPDYFDLINIDFRYQLTVIGATFARAIIFSEIDENNQFVIKTDEPNTKVSWQVTAKRNDQYLIDNPFSDVVDK